MINNSLIEYYRQFIEIVVVLFKPSYRGNLDVKDAGLIESVKLLYDNGVTIKSISRFFSRKKYKNIDTLEHKELVRYFLNSNMAIKAEYEVEEESGKTSKQPENDKAPKEQEKTERYYQNNRALNNSDNGKACEVFNYYAQRVDSINSKMTPSAQELKLINERLKNNTVARLKEAVDGALLTPYIASNGYPLAMIFHACSKVNQLVLVKQRGSNDIESRRSIEIRKALEDVRRSKAAMMTNSTVNGEIYDHEQKSFTTELVEDMS